MKILAALMILLALPAAAQVRQSGNVTPRHVTSWTTTGVIQDGGTAQNSPITDLGTTSSNQQSICAANAAFGGPRSVICLGSTASALYLTTQNTGGGAALPLHFVLNGVDYTWPFPSAPINVPFLAATSFGVVADGVTSNDVALKNALAACSAAGTSLYLPPGKMLLDGTGGQSSMLTNCHLVGAGVPGANVTTSSFGSAFLLTSTTVKPFIVKQNWSVSGVNFYWPNQTTGTTVYPPLFSDDGATAVGNFSLDHIAIINAYDGFAGSTNVGWGAGRLTDSTMYAVNDMIRLNVMFDAWFITSTLFDPGAWISACNSTCFTAINAGALVNTIFHAVGPAGAFAGITANNSGAFDWRYGVRVDATGAFNGSLAINWDGVLTMVDSSSGGNYPPQNIFAGASNGCYTQQYGFAASGNAPCFNLGTQGGLNMNGFKINQAQGSYIVTGGASVDLSAVQFDALGLVADGADYSLIAIPAGNPSVTVRSSVFGGHAGDVHAHGVNPGATILPLLLMQNNRFSFFNDVVNTTGANGKTIVTGNTVGGTTGTKSFIFGNNPITYSDNDADKPPLATVASCGAGATIAGTLNGFVNVGTTNPTSTCNIGLPFVPAAGGGGPCLFQVGNGVALTGGPTGTPPTWTMTTVGAADIHSQNVYFLCSGQK